VTLKTDIYNITKDLFQIHAVLSNFRFIKESSIKSAHKNIKQHHCFLHW